MEMGFHIAYYLQINLFCIVMFVLILFMQSRHNGANTTENVFLRKLIFLTVIYCFTDLLSWYLDGKSGTIAPVISMTTNTMYFGLQNIILYVWLDFVCIKTERTLILNKARSICLLAPLGITTILLLSSPVTKFAFCLDENNYYHRNIGSYVSLFVALGYMIYTAYLLFAFLRDEKNRMNHEDMLALIYFPLPYLVAGVLQMFFYGLDLTQLGLAISVMLLFLHIQFGRISVDELTGLNNRRELKQYLSGIFYRETTESMFICMVDVDFFKTINDTYGHLEGDEALKAIANVLKKACSGQAQRVFLSRYGGDEFVIAGVNYEEKELQKFADSMCEEVKAYNEISKKPYRLTLSIGYSMGKPEQLKSVDELLKKADERMYEVKKKRKRV